MPTPLITSPSQDPQDMRGAIRAFPDHLATGWECGSGADALGLADQTFNGVVVCGMGGSAIGGDLVRTLAEAESSVPFVVNRAYGLPAWVGPSSLVIVSSYSGGTEETLSAYNEATARGATIVAVTSGGDLSARAAEAGQATLTIPGGLQPRAALGYSLGVVLRIARAAGLIHLPDSDFAQALQESRDRATALDLDETANPAREISGGLVGRLPVIYTGTGLLEAVGLRWRTQIHENAKHPCVGNVFPELDHNEIMGFEAAPADLLASTEVIVLRDQDDHPQVQKRYATTRDLVAHGIAGWREVESEGDSRLGRVLSLVQFGDWVSFWLGMRKGVDPTPVETIQALKRTLAA